jgi:hypothetical protein
MPPLGQKSDHMCVKRDRYIVSDVTANTKFFSEHIHYIYSLMTVVCLIVTVGLCVKGSVLNLKCSYTVILFTVPSLPSSLKSAREFPPGFHIYISVFINFCQGFSNSVFLVQLVIPLRVISCSKNFPTVIVSRYISTVVVSSLIRCAGGIFLFLHLS